MNAARRTRSRLRALALPAVAILVGVLAPTAVAAPTPWAGMKTKLSIACADQAVTTPFVPWGDYGEYTFAPNGGFESGATNWTLTGKPSVVNGNEPFFVHSSADAKSLSLPAGATATTPALCTGVNYPWSRLFVAGPSGSTLRVELLYIDSAGVARSATLGFLNGTGTWNPSLFLAYPSFLLAPYSKLSYTDIDGARYTAVALRFTPSGGTWKLDDLHVDPFKLRK